MLSNKKTTPIKINWEGSLFVHHSLGMVNRELLSELVLDPRFDIRHVAFEPDQFIPGPESKYRRIQLLEAGPHSDADIHVRHRWPPDFSTPPSGKLVLIQPWEYGSIPVQWLAKIDETVDELWVYTSYLKMCYIRSGIPEEKIQVVPCGVDHRLFNPLSPPNLWVKKMADNRFCFLFNGGANIRKGVDVLVNAYLSEFKADEPVCLIIKDSPFYGKSIAIKIQELAQRTDVASLIYTADTLEHEDLPGLYTACDCYVHPYRAEGYGLPIAEAMACDIPVIVTGGGASLDFVEPDTSFFIKCSLELIKKKRVGDLDTVDYPYWLLPDMAHLRKLMRFVYREKNLAKEMGRKAGDRIRANHTWAHAAVRAAERLVAVECGGNNQLKPQMLAMAFAHLEVGDFENAVEKLQEILSLHGECGDAYIGLAIAAEQLEKYESSFEFYRKADLVMPGNPDVLINWYEVAKKVRRVEELSGPLIRALDLNENNEDLIEIAGMIL
jgi:glycosyltransferase involved in cell wall biosynthesis